MAYPSWSPFTYYFADLASGAIKGALPLTGVSFQKILNGVGQFQGTIDLADPNIANLDWLDQTLPSRSAVFVDYNGVIVWGGIVQARSYAFQPQSRKLSITASDCWSYFQQRIQATDYSAPPFSGITGPNSAMAIWNLANADSDSEWDPVLVAWQTIADALNNVNYGSILGGVGIAANSFTSAAAYLASASGTPQTEYINVTYPYSSLQTIDTIVSQLTQLGLNVGFDKGFDVAWSAGPLSVPVGTVNLSYPRRGRTFANNNLMVDLSTSRSYTFPEDGTQTANVIYETGGQGAISVIENLNPLLQGYPIWEAVKSRSNITSALVLALLANIGLSDLFYFSYPAVVPTFQISLFDPNLPLGSFIEGDDVQIYIPSSDGITTPFDPRFPSGYQGEWRIASYTATVGDDGDSTLDVTLNQPPALGFALVPAI